METDQIPEDLPVLAHWLTSQGFTLTEHHVSSAFGDRLLLFEREPCRVRLVRDRGQWFLEIAGPTTSDWFDADIWRSCLEGRDPPLDPTAPSAQAAYLRTSLSHIDDAIRGNSVIADCLRQRGRWRARARLGLTGQQ